MLDLESSREWIGSNAAYGYFNMESLQSLDNCFLVTNWKGPSLPDLG